MVKRLNAYTADFKPAVLVMRHAEGRDKRAAGQKFGVYEKCARSWILQKKEQLASTNRNRKAFHGKRCKFPGLEDQLVEYVSMTRKNGYAVSSEMICAKADEVSSSDIESESDVE